MPRLRVFEVAQQINKTNKEVLDYLKENNVNVKSHMSTLEEKDEKMVRDALGAKGDKNEENKQDIGMRTGKVLSRFSSF